MKISEEKSNFIKKAREIAVNPPTITRKEILMMERQGYKWPHWFVNNRKFRQGRGVYLLPDISDSSSSSPSPSPTYSTGDVEQSESGS